MLRHLGCLVLCGAVTLGCTEPNAGYLDDPDPCADGRCGGDASLGDADNQLDMGRQTIDIPFGKSDSGSRLDANIDAASPDARILDAAVKTDGAFDSDAVTDAQTDAFVIEDNPCQPEPAREISTDIEFFENRLTISTGSALPAESVLAQNIDGSVDESIEFVIAHGGRLEVTLASGQSVWRSPVLGITRVVGLYDFDGDGRLEILGSTGRTLYIFDALSGLERWSLSDALSGERPFVFISRSIVADFDGDDIDDLYIVDGGCGDAGSGTGLIFKFSSGRGVIIQRIRGDRDNGRCGRWQIAYDVDRDGFNEVLITDGRGLNAFDSRTGAKVVCGAVLDAPPNGPLPTLLFEDEDPGWFIFYADHARLLRIDEGADCPQGLSFSAHWATPYFDRIRAEGSRVMSTGGTPTLLTSVWSNAQREWSVVALAQNDSEVLLNNAVLVGSKGTKETGDFELLVYRDAGSDIIGPQPRCSTFRWDADTEQLLELANLSNCMIFRQDQEPPGSSLEFRQPITPISPSGPEWMAVKIRTDNGLIYSQIHRGRTLTPWSEEFLGLLGPVKRLCQGTSTCQSRLDLDGLAIITEEGEIGILNPSGQLINPSTNDPNRPALNRPSGLSKVSPTPSSVGPLIAVINSVGRLMSLAPDRQDAPLLWSVLIGNPHRGGSFFRVNYSDATGAQLLVRDPRFGQNNISLFDGETGRLEWRHTIDDRVVKSMRVAEYARGPEGKVDRVIRYDRVRASDVILTSQECPLTQTVGESNMNPGCQNPTPYPLYVTALALDDGRCLWQTQVIPFDACYGPSQQTLSVVNRGAASEIYITESRAVHRLDALTGQLLATGDLGIIPGGVGRGGGWMRATPDGGLLRLGGNGPPEAFTPQLTRRWRAPDIEGLRNQSWIGQDGYISDNHLWIVPGSGLPIHRYSLQTGALVDTIAVAFGARLNAQLPDGLFVTLKSLTPSKDGDIDVIGVGEDGYVYGFNNDGQLLWAKPFTQDVGTAHFVQLVDEDEPELLVSNGDGHIDILSAPGLPPTPEVWDIPCPPSPMCDTSEDIDETETTTTLCAEWVPVDNGSAAEIRVIASGGVVVSEWTAVRGQSYAQVDGLNLTPGILYRIQVRLIDGDRMSQSVATDGILVTNVSAPEIVVSLSTERFQSQANTVDIFAELTDDDRLAGWSMTISDARTGAHIRRIGSGPLDVAGTVIQRSWDGRDRLNALVEPGFYRVDVTATDRTGNMGVSSIEVEVCEGPCSP